MGFVEIAAGSNPGLCRQEKMDVELVSLLTGHKEFISSDQF